MKIGPFNLSTTKAIELKDSRSVRPVLNEVGGTGTLVFGGRLLQQDYNADWSFPAAYALIDRMRKSDGTVKLGLRSIKLPLIQAEWKVEAASDSAEDKAIADFCQYDIDHLSTSFKQTLQQILLHLDYGSMPFELVWEAGDDRKIHLRKLAPRMPHTILFWNVDPGGGLVSISQQLNRDDGPNQIEIPVEKLAVFVNEREASDWRGTSLLRASYQHWYYKSGFYKIDAIAKEKRGAGIDVGSISENADNPPQVKSEIERVLQTMHTHEKQYLTENAKDWTYRVEGLTGQLPDMLGSIQHHDLLILRAMMADFHTLGSEGARGGSYALAKDKSSYSLMSLTTIADLIAEVWTDYVIKKLVDYNFPGVVDYPRFAHGRLDTRDLASFADTVQKLIASGALTNDQSVEDVTREVLELPEFERPEVPDVPDVPPMDALPANIPPLPLPAPGSFTRTFSREPRGPETFVDFALLAGGMDAAEQRILEAVAAVQERQVRSLVELGGRILASGKREAIENVSVPFKAEITRAVAAELGALYALGRRETRRELAAQTVTISLSAAEVAPEDSAPGYLESRARATANALGDRLKSTFTFAMLEALRRGETSTDVLAARLSALSLREVKRAASVGVTEALNMGRNTFAKENKPSIQEATYSALMDKETCDPCAEADGETFEVGSEEYDAHEPPYQECEGQGNCRCVYVFT